MRTLSKTIVRSSSTLVLALVAMGVPQVHAASSPIQAMTPSVTVTGNQVDFFAHCDEEGVSSTVRLGWQSDARLLSPDRFNPSCMMSGNEDGASYLCKCNDGGSVVVGEIEAQTLFPDGEIPFPEPGMAPVELQDLIGNSCKTVFNEKCGPFPQDIEVTCESEHGLCGVDTWVGEKVGEHKTVSADCTCTSGHSWESHDDAREPVSFTEDQANAICAAELANCDPAATAGPSDLDYFDPELLESRGAACARDYDLENPSNSTACYVKAHEGGLDYTCYRGEEEVQSGSEFLDSIPSRIDLHASCLAYLDQLPSDPIPEPGSKPPAPSKDDIGDALDKIGCSVSSNTPWSPWLISLAGLGLLGIRRSRGREHAQATPRILM